jgi:hypothetical protein
LAMIGVTPPPSFDCNPNPSTLLYNLAISSPQQVLEMGAAIYIMLQSRWSQFSTTVCAQKENSSNHQCGSKWLVGLPTLLKRILGDLHTAPYHNDHKACLIDSRWMQ